LHRLTAKKSETRRDLLRQIAFAGRVKTGTNGKIHSDVHEPVRLEPELGLEPVRFVEGWARGVRARGAGSSLGSSFIIKKIIKKIKIFINDTKYLIFG
jgi:hypothetical protein